MPHYNTVIFDLDGTLLNTLDDLASAVNYAMRQMGWPVRTTEEVRRFVGNGVKVLIDRASPAASSEAERAQCLEVFRRWYSDHSQDNTAPYPGIPQLLRELKAMGCKVAVVSNKYDAAVKALMEDYFPGAMDATAGENEAAGVPKKPDPAMVLRTMQLLGAEPDSTVYVGDSEVDLLTARNAGLPCIAVTWGFRDEAQLVENGAVLLAHTTDELMEMIR